MTRLLVLAFERPSHPDAVAHAATADDVHLVLELLSTPRAERLRWSQQLRNFLAQQSALPPRSRPAVPCRRASGLYVLVPWRLAKWLCVVLPATDSVIERTSRRLEQWLASGTAQVINAAC